VDYVEKEYGKKFDYVIELMATNPFKTSIQIDEILEKLHDTGADSVIAVTRVWDHHPARIKKMDERGRLVDFCIPEPSEARRQDLRPPAYIRCGSIYALSRNYLMRTKARYGSVNSYAHVIPEAESINIDDELDFELAEITIKKRRETNK
jgi:CMP-N-acetylneuraminic acid synthetase